MQTATQSPSISNIDRRDLEVIEVHKLLRFRDRRDASYTMQFIERNYFVSMQHVYKSILGRKVEQPLDPAQASIIYHKVLNNEYYDIQH